MDFGRITDPQAWKQAMAGLLRRGGEVGEYIEQAPEKAGQAIIEGHKKNQELQAKAFANPDRPFQVTDQNAFNELNDRYLGGVLSFAPMGITAWHGSPHTFDKFDMKKVGTGEGAQAYGHGMYFAESPEVARTYATSGKYESANDYAQHFLAENKGNKDLALKALNNEVAHFDKNGWTADISKDMVKDIEKSIKNGVQGSNLYKVDIPDEHIPMMLDWDKPLSKQPKSVQEALAKFDPDMYSVKGADYDPSELGQSIYQRIIQNNVQKFGHGGNQQRASEQLNSLGIKGIRYFDEGSRGANQGTSNFVVFDPTGVKILERNNQPLSRKEILQEQLDKINQPNKGDVLVNMPLSMIEHGESAMQGGKLTWPTANETIKSYAAKETPFPPIRVVGPYVGEAPNKIPFMIDDGSHRFEAAKLRGDKTIPTYITPEDYELFKKLGGL